MDAVERRRLPVVGQGLEAQLEIGQRVRIEQLAQLLLAEQLAQQVAVERQRAGAALGDRRVAVVHVGGDVVEHEAARERRGAHRLDAVDGDLAARDAGQDLAQGRAGRRRPTGTRGTSRPGSGTSRSARRPPAGRPPAGAAARAASACPAGVAAGAAPAPRSRGSGWRTAPTSRAARRRGPRPRRARGTAAPRCRRAARRPRAAGSRCRRPTRSSGPPSRAARRCAPRAPATTGVDAAAERGQQAQPPVAQLVAEALDDDPLVGRQGARRLALVVEIGEQVGGGALVEVVRLAQPGGRGGPALLAAGEVGLELADERAHRPAELDRPPDRVAVPERQLAGHARAPG